MLLFAYMAFPSPIWDLLPFQLQEEIIQAAKVMGARQASIDYCDRAGMNQVSLYQKLLKMNKNLTPEDKRKKKEAKKKLKENDKITMGFRTVTRKEKELLNRFEEGAVTLEEVSRKIARIAFENILSNPGSVKYADFIKTELLKLKQEEGKFKEAWGKELLQRVFAGKLPPPVCPSCGYSFMSKTHSVEGELLTDEPANLPESIQD